MAKDMQQKVDKLLRRLETRKAYPGNLMKLGVIQKAGQCRKSHRFGLRFPYSGMQLDRRRFRHLIEVGIGAEMLLPGLGEPHFARGLSLRQTIAQGLDGITCTL